MSRDPKILTERLNVEGVELDVDFIHYSYYPGAYEKGGAQLSPDEPAHDEVQDVRIAGTDISLFNMIDCMNGFDVIEVELAKREIDDSIDERDDDE